MNESRRVKVAAVLACLALLGAGLAEAQLTCTATVPDYVPGGFLPVTFDLDYTGPNTVTALGMTVELPDGCQLGWEDESVCEPDITEVPPVPTANAQTPDPVIIGDPPECAPYVSPIEIFWLEEQAEPTVYTFPMQFTLMVQLPSEATAGQTFTGTCRYRFAAGELTTPPAAATAIEGVCGDATGNGTINIGDALAIQQYLAALIPAIPQPALADATKDGTVNIGDALRIRQYLAALIGDPCAAK